MNLPEEPQLQQKLKNLEGEIHQTTPLVEENKAAWIETVQTLQNSLGKLPPIWKVVLIVGAVILFFSVLNIFFKLVSALISLAIIFIIIYAAYRFIIFSASSKSPEE